MLETLKRKRAVRIAERVELRDGERKHQNKVRDDQATQLLLLNLRAKRFLIAEGVEHKVDHLWSYCHSNELIHCLALSFYATLTAAVQPFSG
jgi:hypothetical protein